MMATILKKGGNNRYNKVPTLLQDKAASFGGNFS